MDGHASYAMHAEMNVLRFSEPGDTLEIIRFLKDGTFTMAKPCCLCAKKIANKRISEVRFTNWHGNWELLDIREENTWQKAANNIKDVFF